MHGATMKISKFVNSLWGTFSAADQNMLLTFQGHGAFKCYPIPLIEEMVIHCSFLIKFWLWVLIAVWLYCSKAHIRYSYSNSAAILAVADHHLSYFATWGFTSFWILISLPSKNGFFFLILSENGIKYGTLGPGFSSVSALCKQPYHSLHSAWKTVCVFP